METIYQNKLLKIAAIMMIVFSLVAAGVGCFNVSQTLAEAASLDPFAMAQMNEVALAESGGTVTAQDAVGFVSIVAYVSMGFMALGNLLRAIVGGCALSRANKPEKHVFFLIWGIVFTVIGVFGVVNFTLYGLVNLLGGLVPAILFIIGSTQSKKAFFAAKASASAPIPVAAQPEAPASTEE